MIVVPEPVYCATDGSLPRWRFIIAAVNRSRGILEVVSLRERVHGSDAVRQRSFRGEALASLVVQGGLALRPKDVVAFDILDDGRAKRPGRVNVRIEFAARNGQVLSLSRTVNVVRRRTSWIGFPLRGEWVAANARADIHCLGRQFGLDFVTPADMRLHSSPPARKCAIREFSSFARPICSPVGGVVVSCSSNHRDFVPTPGSASLGGKRERLGKMVGNHVLIRMGEEQYLLLAHMRRGSVRVREGECVRRGQLLGQTGNSGNTSGPHLHIELIDGVPDLSATKMPDVSGLPFGFRQIKRVRDGTTKLLRRCVPKKLDSLQASAV